VNMFTYVHQCLWRAAHSSLAARPQKITALARAKVAGALTVLKRAAELLPVSHAGCTARLRHKEIPSGSVSGRSGADVRAHAATVVLHWASYVTSSGFCPAVAANG
jgi:hypothetical protein